MAEQNRARAVVIEKERVIRAQEMEEVNRHREVELSIIDKDKALEEEKKIILVITLNDCCFVHINK